jgi:hypothetical protein
MNPTRILKHTFQIHDSSIILDFDSIAHIDTKFRKKVYITSPRILLPFDGTIAMHFIQPGFLIIFPTSKFA